MLSSLIINTRVNQCSHPSSCPLFSSTLSPSSTLFISSHSSSLHSSSSLSLFPPRILILPLIFLFFLTPFVNSLVYVVLGFSYIFSRFHTTFQISSFFFEHSKIFNSHPFLPSFLPFLLSSYQCFFLSTQKSILSFDCAKTFYNHLFFILVLYLSKYPFFLLPLLKYSTVILPF